MAVEAMKDVIACDKLAGEAANILLVRRFLEWGNPPVIRQVSYDEYIVIRGEQGEVKHLSTLRKRNQLGIPSVAASERGKAS